MKDVLYSFGGRRKGQLGCDIVISCGSSSGQIIRLIQSVFPDIHVVVLEAASLFGPRCEKTCPLGICDQVRLNLAYSAT